MEGASRSFNPVKAELDFRLGGIHLHPPLIPDAEDGHGKVEPGARNGFRGLDRVTLDRSPARVSSNPRLDFRNV